MSNEASSKLNSAKVEREGEKKDVNKTPSSEALMTPRLRKKRSSQDNKKKLRSPGLNERLASLEPFMEPGIHGLSNLLERGAFLASRRPSESAQNDSHKNRLVDRFYNSLAITPREERQERNSFDSQLDPNLGQADILSRLLSQGIQFDGFRDYSYDDEKLLVFMLNIDTILDDAPVTTLRDTALLPLTVFSNRINRIALELRLKVFNSACQSNEIDLICCLRELSLHLSVLQNSACAALESLDSSCNTLLSSRYETLQDNVNKMRHFFLILQSLEERFSRIRATNTANKQVLFKEVPEKLALLEEIDYNIKRSTKYKRNRRFRFLFSLVFTSLVVFLSYIGYQLFT